MAKFYHSSDSIIIQPRPQSFAEYLSYEYNERDLLPVRKKHEVFATDLDEEDKYIYPYPYTMLTGTQLWRINQRQGYDVDRVAEWNPYVLPPSLTGELSSSASRDAYNVIPNSIAPPSTIEDDHSEFGRLIDYNRSELRM